MNGARTRCQLEAAARAVQTSAPATPPPEPPQPPARDFGPAFGFFCLAISTGIVPAGILALWQTIAHKPAPPTAAPRPRAPRACPTWREKKSTSPKRRAPIDPAERPAPSLPGRQ